MSEPHNYELGVHFHNVTMAIRIAEKYFEQLRKVFLCGILDVINLEHVLTNYINKRTFVKKS